MHQVPSPPQAPSPPGSEMVVQGTLDGWELALILLIVFGALLALAWPFLRSLARRLERPPLDPEVLVRLDRLEGGLHRVQTLEDRLAELEERVDFAERFLPRPGERKVQEALPPTQRSPSPEAD
jgi:hypothetical protein